MQVARHDVSVAKLRLLRQVQAPPQLGPKVLSGQRPGSIIHAGPPLRFARVPSVQDQTYAKLTLAADRPLGSIKGKIRNIFLIARPDCATILIGCSFIHAPRNRAFIDPANMGLL